MTGLNWFWIGLELTAVPLVAVLAAFPLWTRNQMIFGNIAGTVVIFGTAIALIVRETIQIDNVTRECLDKGVLCWPEPSALTRFAIYACIGLVEVITLFAVSLRVEKRLRDRDYSPEWR